MVAATDIPVTRVDKSRIKDLDFSKLVFGRFFTDHMLEADYEDGIWKTVSIRPYQPITIQPSLATLHYGQSIFEGIKAYKNPSGKPFIFRPFDNHQRFNISAARMQMPDVPEEIFIGGMKRLIGLDQQWIPEFPDHSLYIRPFMFSTEESIGVRASEKYKFMIILSPTGPYYAQPMRIYVEEFYTRAAPGGVGFAKTAGNYAAAMHPTAEARRQGYDQVLWTDAFEHKYVQEIGTMNVFFIIGKKAITPDLNSGTILAGVTRDSAITLLKEMGYEVEERPVSIDEIMDSYKRGELTEIFGTGTAATISPIRELKYKDFVMDWDVSKWKAAPEVKKRLDAIREGRVPDTHGWMFPV